MPESGKSELRPSLAAWALWIYVLIAVGRVGELIPGFGSLPLAKVAIALAVIASVAERKSSQHKPILASPISRTGLWLVALAAVLVPFSVLFGASARYFVQTVLVLAVSHYLIFRLCSSWAMIRKTLAALAISGGTLAFLAVVNYSGGRAELDTSYDTNDLAYVLVTVLPIAVALSLTSKGRVRYLMAGISTLMLLGALLTQSRGGFLGVAAALLYIALFPAAVSDKPSKTNRFRILLVVALVSTAVWTVLPQDVKTRIGTLASIGSDYNVTSDDSTGRMDIWKRGIRSSFKRPIGHGLDTFGHVDFQSGGRYKAAHNSLVQITVELGYIGLFLYVACYWRAWLALRRARSVSVSSGPEGTSREMRIIAKALQSALIANFVAGFFLSQAYSNLTWVLMACIAAFGVLLVGTSVAGAQPSGSSLASNVRFTRSLPVQRSTGRNPPSP